MCNYMEYHTNDTPSILRDFLTYHEAIQGHSKKTVDEYFLDLRNFFRYLKIEKVKFLVLLILILLISVMWIWS